MKQRTTQPKNCKFYIRTSSGGYNGAVAGYPTISGANVLCNCVGYANGRFNEIILDPNLKGLALKFRYQLVCNAENFIEAAQRQGLKISKTPTLGGIMVWQKGATLSGSDGAGHVAVVEQINKDGSIITSESGYGAFAFKRIARKNTNGRWGQGSGYKFRGCIINPSIGAVTAPATTTKTENATTKTVTYKVVEKSGMNIRDKASAGGKKIGSIAYGKTFTSSKTSGNWAYYDAKKGWVCIKSGSETYLKKQ